MLAISSQYWPGYSSANSLSVAMPGWMQTSITKCSGSAPEALSKALTLLIHEFDLQRSSIIGIPGNTDPDRWITTTPHSSQFSASRSSLPVLAFVHSTQFAFLALEICYDYDKGLRSGRLQYTSGLTDLK